MKVDDVLVPQQARISTYELLALKSPERVVIDSDLEPGQWYVVRGPWHHERAAVDRAAAPERRERQAAAQQGAA
ncbi:MAG: hypothetical protein HY856_13500 [Burkholderiales bacterium]|nr:hypothetical protein [Burkholderiales bacterium]